ncbi:MAG: glycosyltransferase family 4 protein [Lachnospiraceae bacterium]|nr:glycosyltransferase family 4 protein [Lachnospiraceae bacterium]
MKKMNNILLVSTNGKLTNGASQCVLMIAQNLKRRGVNAVVAAPPGELGRELRKCGITVEPLYQYVTMWFRHTNINFDKQWKNIAAKIYYSGIYKQPIHKIVQSISVKDVSSRMESIIKKHDIDLVHINAVTSGLPALMPFKMGIPVVWHIRELLSSDLNHKFVNEKRSYNMLNRADAVIAVSDMIKNHFQPHIKKEIIRIYDGVDVEKFYSSRDILKNDVIRIVMTGRIHANKGQDILIKAVNMLVKSGIKVTADIYGNTNNVNYENSLKAYIARNGLSDTVHLKGYVDNVNKVLTDYDVLCMCSKSEAFGLTTVEGMLSGALVVGSDSETAATSELIKDGVTGLLYDSEEGAKGLFKALKRVADNRESMKKIALEGQKYAYNTFSIDNNINNILEVYDEVLHRRNRS